MQRWLSVVNLYKFTVCLLEWVITVCLYGCFISGVHIDVAGFAKRNQIPQKSTIELATPGYST